MSFNRQIELEGNEILKRQTPVPNISKSIERELYIRKDYVYLDSRQRDKKSWPKSCQATFPIGQVFKNVESVRLVDIQLPNAAHVIDSTNNTIVWENFGESDTRVVMFEKMDDTFGLFDLGGTATATATATVIIVYVKQCTAFPDIEGDRQLILDPVTFKYRLDYDFQGQLMAGPVQVTISFKRPAYSVTIKPGNYSITSIVAQIESSMNNYNYIASSNIFRRFLVSASEETNIITFRQFKTRGLANNPISTVINSTTIVVSIINHGFKVGQVICLFDTIPVSNILKTQLDGLHTITDITDNSISFEITIPAQTTSGGGGQNVLIGSSIEFKLKFGPGAGSIDLPLGFPRESSSIGLDNTQTRPVFGLITALDLVSGSTVKVTATSGSGGFDISSLVPGKRLTLVSVTQHLDIQARLVTLTPHFITKPTVVKVNANNLNGDYIVIPNSLTELYTVETHQIIELSETFTSGSFIYGGDAIRFTQVAGARPDINFQIESVIDSSNFLVNIPNFIDIGPSPGARVETSRLEITQPGHGFNTVTGIKQLSGPRVEITCQLAHNFTGKIYENIITTRVSATKVRFTINSHNIETQSVITVESNSNTDFRGDFIVNVVDASNLDVLYSDSNPVGNYTLVSVGARVTISDTDCVPKLHGEFGIDTIVTGNPFKFIVYTTPLTQDGTTGILGYYNEITLSRPTGSLVDFPGTDIDTIDLCTFKVFPTSQNTYHARSNTIFSRVTSDNDLNNTFTCYLSSERHGFRTDQSNTNDWTSGLESILYRRVSLEGENYVFLCCPQISLILNDANSVKDIAYKIPIDVNPGRLVFHTGVFADIHFYPNLARLADFFIELRRYDGTLFDIQNLDYSLTFEIVQQGVRFKHSERHTNIASILDKEKRIQ